ncbi:unnamed protein product [Rhizophagus irregularis]|nr:unnamed protein product [Rhizophagus irregularis]
MSQRMLSQYLRDIGFYRGAIERKEDPRKYYTFLTDHERLIDEELLRHEVYLLSLETIADTCLKTEKDPRYEMAQLLLDKHKVDRSDPELGYGTVDNSKNSERKQKESDDDDFQPVPDRQQKRKKNLSLPKDQ